MPFPLRQCESCFVNRLLDMNLDKPQTLSATIVIIILDGKNNVKFPKIFFKTEHNI